MNHEIIFLVKKLTGLIIIVPYKKRKNLYVILRMMKRPLR